MHMNFRIGTRLIAAFMLLAALGMAVGLVGLTGASKINARAVQLYDNELMGLSHIKEANIEPIAIGGARSKFLLARPRAAAASNLALASELDEAPFTKY